MLFKVIAATELLRETRLDYEIFFNTIEIPLVAFALLKIVS